MSRTTPKPRILLIGPLPPTHGGVTTLMLNIRDSFLAEEFEFVGFTTSRPPKKNVTNNWGYGAVLRGGLPRILAGILITLWHLVKFPFVLVFGRIAAVHVFSSNYFVFWESMCYVWMARMLRRPTLLWLVDAFDRFHQDSGRFMRRQIERSIRVPGVLLVQSQSWRKVIARLGRTHEVEVLYSSLPEDNLAEAPARTGVGPPRCLFIAGLEARRKGVDELIVAIYTLERRGIAAKYRVLATTPILARELRERQVGHLIDACGYVDRASVLREMAQADIFLMPSHYEGLPSSLQEAMAQHLPVVATRVGAIPEVLDDERGGVLVDPGDSAALADAMARLIADPMLRREMGRHNAATVRERFTNRTVLPVLAGAYRRLLERSGRPLTAGPTE